MNQSFKESIWNQFGASIDMLENAIHFCPDSLWDENISFSIQAYHTLFFLDYYLTLDPVGFGPRPPFSYSEFEGELPKVGFSKTDILSYLDFNRNKCHDLIMSLTDQLCERRWINESKSMNFSVFEILLYNMRHVQHHVGQLNLMLRQKIDGTPKWVYRALSKPKL